VKRRHEIIVSNGKPRASATGSHILRAFSKPIEFLPRPAYVGANDFSDPLRFLPICPWSTPP